MTVRAFYGSKISENMTTTPEGFLICLNVPIARTGMQEYLGYEMGLDDQPDEIIQVYRTEEEVFDPATIASFEGKCVTEDHPPDTVTPENVTAYNSGHAQHVRRGAGDESDLLIADLFITDPRLIDAISKGLREVSCGYDCEYVQEDGKYYQRRIRGNHVAVVASGRAGHRVAIKDSTPEPESKELEGTKTMENKNKNSILARLFGHAVKDMEPDQIADAVDEMVSQAAPADETPAPAPAAEPANDEGGEWGPQILAAIKALGEQIAALAKPAAAPAPDADPLQQLADELAAPAQEKTTTIPADSEPDATDENGPIAPEEQKAENPIPGADHAAALAAIAAVKPIIAALPESQRKSASDKAAAEIRKLIGKDAKPASNGYSGIAATVQQAAKDKAKEAKKPQNDNGETGRAIMAARNPHYMKK